MAGKGGAAPEVHGYDIGHMVLPVVSPAAKVLTDDATYKRFGEELELGIKCAQSVLTGLVRLEGG